MGCTLFTPPPPPPFMIRPLLKSIWQVFGAQFGEEKKLFETYRGPETLVSKNLVSILFEFIITRQGHSMQCAPCRPVYSYPVVHFPEGYTCKLLNKKGFMIPLK